MTRDTKIKKLETEPAQGRAVLILKRNSGESRKMERVIILQGLYEKAKRASNTVNITAQEFVDFFSIGSPESPTTTLERTLNPLTRDGLLTYGLLRTGRTRYKITITEKGMNLLEG